MVKTVERDGVARTFGWFPSLPDFRDHTPYTHIIPGLVGHRFLAAARPKPKPPHPPKPTPPPPPPPTPSSIDLRQWCTPIEDQDGLGSCTANAGAGMLEYLENKAFGAYHDGSRLFLYLQSRKIGGLYPGDNGSYLRDTMKAMATYGVAREPTWPYDVSKFDVEPPQPVYDEADDYQSIEYFRYDLNFGTMDNLIATLKAGVAGGLAAMFGFTVYSSIPWSGGTGDIPIPQPGESVLGGHAMVIVGYDDARPCLPAGSKPGAWLIRNSWGTGWGDGGYGWLPYEYIRRWIMNDIWSLVRTEYVASALFASPTAIV